MKEILCNKCKRVLVECGEVIAVSIVSFKSGKDVEIVSDEGISVSILTSKYFCSVECLKESII